MAKNVILWFGNDECNLTYADQVDKKLIECKDTGSWFWNKGTVKHLNPALVSFPPARLKKMNGVDKDYDVYVVFQNFSGTQVRKPYGSTYEVYEAQKYEAKYLLLQRKLAAMMDNLMNASSLQEVRKMLSEEMKSMGELKKKMQPFSSPFGRNEEGQRGDFE